MSQGLCRSGKTANDLPSNGHANRFRPIHDNTPGCATQDGRNHKAFSAPVVCHFTMVGPSTSCGIRSAIVSHAI